MTTPQRHDSFSDITTADVTAYMTATGWRRTSDTTRTGTYWDLVAKGSRYCDVLIPDRTEPGPHTSALIARAISDIAAAENRCVDDVANTIAASDPQYHLSRIASPQWTIPAWPATVRAIVNRLAGRISAADIHSHLRRGGWRLDTTNGLGIQEWHNPNLHTRSDDDAPAIIAVPNADAVVADKDHLVAAVYRLAYIEDRSVREVACQLAGIGREPGNDNADTPASLTTSPPAVASLTTAAAPGNGRNTVAAERSVALTVPSCPPSPVLHDLRGTGSRGDNSQCSAATEPLPDSA